MKKGLRRRALRRPLRMRVSDHRPDEEGIKTGCRRRSGTGGPLSDHRPDEEGIKTKQVGVCAHPLLFQTTDLMKKGLRPRSEPLSVLRQVSDHRPDEEGIKTSRSWRTPRARSFQTTDLMKKGLRRRPRSDWSGWCRFRPQT